MARSPNRVPPLREVLMEDDATGPEKSIFEPERSGDFMDQVAQVQFEPLAPIQNRELLPFPVDALGSVAATAIAAIAEWSQTPTDLPGCLALGAMAGAIARRVVVEVNHREEISLYIAVVMPPGSRKSGVFSEIMKPIFERERALVEIASPERARNRSAVALAAKSIKAFERILANPNTNDNARALANAQWEKAVEELRIAERKPTTDPQLITSDATPEKLAIIAKDNQERLILGSGEGSQIFDRLSRYSKNSESNCDLLLSAHDGEWCRVDRVVRESVILERPVFTINATIQPGVLKKLGGNQEFTERGLIARLAFSMPRDLRGTRDVFEERQKPMNALASWRSLMDRILRVHSDSDRPLILSVDRDALAVFKLFAHDMEVGQRQGGAYESMEGWAAKAAGLVLRIAGVLAVAWCPGDPRITPEVMAHAVDLGRYFADHAVQAHDFIDGRTGDREIDRIWGWVKKSTSRSAPTADFTRQELWQAMKGPRSIFQRASQMDAALRRIEAAGRIAKRDLPAPESGGRPPSVWAVNPEALRHEPPDV